MKKCPFCAEEIQDEAIKCKHCHQFLGARKQIIPGDPSTNIAEGELLLKQRQGTTIKIALEDAWQDYQAGKIRSHEMLFDPETRQWYYPGRFPPFKGRKMVKVAPSPKRQEPIIVVAPEFCPNCGSVAIEQKAGFDDMWVFGGIGWVLLLPLIYQLFLRPALPKNWYCRSCKYIWQ